MKITSKQLRNAWLDFYKSKNHTDIGSVSLIGDGTTGVMFNVAGMQPLMPYLLGQKHQSGTKLCNIQGCVRTNDIETIGDQSHLTFFEMMGNWSLGDYFKKEKTTWSFELLTNIFGLDKNKICCSVFAGNQDVERDEETANYLIELGIKKENIFYLDKADNWWELEGTVGTPCGPDNEWFYPLHDNACGDKCDITCDCGRYVEIGNDVYMQYEKTANGYKPLQNKNVDTGFGFERMLIFLNGLDDVYQTDLFSGVMDFIKQNTTNSLSQDDAIKSTRIIADHMRTSVMLIGDQNGIEPSNVGAGYVLRRLMRRAIRHAKTLGLNFDLLVEICKMFITQVYAEAYANLVEKQEYILDVVAKEIEKFNKTIETGIKEFDKILNNMNKKVEFIKLKNPEYVQTEQDKCINGKTAFRLYDTFGFPLELTVEMAEENGLSVNGAEFEECFKAHQEMSKAGLKQEFKSGVGGQGEEYEKLHTATHMLLGVLKKLYGEQVNQRGSNITADRLRFDFNFDRKLEKTELDKIEQEVNTYIKQSIEVQCEVMSKEQAKQSGATGIFDDKYADEVTVYTIGDISKEFCSGPHVKNTSQLGVFKISKEESSSAGVRRIKAVLN